MALAYVRKATAANATTISISPSFASAPPADRLLVAICTNNNEVASTWTAPAGWSRAVDSTSTGSFTLGTTIFYRITAAGEPTSYAFSTTLDNRKVVTILEISGALTDQALVLDRTATNESGGNDVSSLSTGTTAQTRYNNEIAIAAMSVGKGTTTAPTWSPWTAPLTYTSASTLTTAASNITSHNVAYRIQDTLFSPGPTANWSPAQRAVGAVATFRAAEATSSGSGVSTVTGYGSVTTQTSAPSLGGESVVSEEASVAASGHRETALERVQSTDVVAVNDATSISANWPVPTTTGSLLLAVVGTAGGGDAFDATFSGTFGSSDVTITPPSGWTALPRTVNTGNVIGQVFYMADAPAQVPGGAGYGDTYGGAGYGATTGDDIYDDIYGDIYPQSAVAGAVTFGLSGARDAVLQLIEVTGAAQAPLDVSAFAFGTSGTASTGATPTTTEADEYWFGALFAQNVTSFSNPTDGFAIIAQGSSGVDGSSQRVSMATLDSQASSLGVASTSASLAASRPWAGFIATFKVVSIAVVEHQASGVAETISGASATATPTGVNTGIAQTISSASATATLRIVVLPGGGVIIPAPDPQETAVLLSHPVVALDFTEIRNVVEVLGAKPEKGIKRIRAVAYARKDHPLSPWSLARNGEPRYIVETIETGLAPRTKTKSTGTKKKGDDKPFREFEKAIHESVVKRRDHAQAIADRELAERLESHVEVTFDCLPQPHLEIGDKVLLRSSTAGRIEFRLRRFSLPLSAGAPMSIGLNRKLRLLKRRKKKRRRQKA